MGSRKRAGHYFDANVLRLAGFVLLGTELGELVQDQVHGKAYGARYRRLGTILEQLRKTRGILLDGVLLPLRTLMPKMTITLLAVSKLTASLQLNDHTHHYHPALCTGMS